MAHEIAAGYEFLTATLSGDSTLMSLVTGIYRGAAPIDAMPPFVVMNFQAGQDVRSGNEVRLLSKPLFLVKVVGPSTMMDTIVSAAARADALLQPQQGGHSSGTATGAFIDACYRENPFAQEDPPVNGVQWSNLGGLYRLEVQLTS